MGWFNIRPGSFTPAQKLLEQLPDPARQWNYDVQFITNNIRSDISKMHYFVKQIDKPKYDFIYADMNQYGYRSKVLTRIEKGSLGITFLDDTGNTVLAFIDEYLALSVNSDKNKRYLQTGTIPIMEENGFDSAGVSARSGLGQTVIKEIVISQYAGLSPNGTGEGRIRTWTFEEPQIEQFDLDQHSSESDDLSGFVVRFNFKNVVIRLNQPNYPPTPEIKEIIDVFAPFFDIDVRTILPNLDLEDSNQLEISTPTRDRIGELSSDSFGTSNQDADRLVREGSGLARSTNDALGPQNVRSTINLGRNDLVRTIPQPVVQVGNKTVDVPTDPAVIDSKLDKLGF